MVRELDQLHPTTFTPDYLSSEDTMLAYARRLVLLAGASSLYPGVLQELNHAAHREALLLFHSSSAVGPSIFYYTYHRS